MRCKKSKSDVISSSQAFVRFVEQNSQQGLNAEPRYMSGTKNTKIGQTQYRYIIKNIV